MTATTDLEQADVETKTRTWSLTDADSVALVPDAITFYARRNAPDTPVTWTVGDGVVNNADGTGTWTVTAADLAAGRYVWWALVTTGTNVVIPSALTGTLTITDR